MTMNSSTINVENLVDAGVAEADASELLAMGLPTRTVGHLDCKPEQIEGSLVLAHDSDVPLVVRAGEVRALDGTDRLVNTSVRAFSSMVERYATYVNEVRSVATDEEGEQIARAAAATMAQIDPGGFEQEDSYWPIVCAQMVAGNL